MPRGVESAKKDQEANPLGGSGGGGDFINRVLLFNDQEFAEIRFLTEFDEMYWEWAHRYQTVVGNAGRTIWQTRVCPKQNGQECGRCADGQVAARVFWYWVYVYNFYWQDPGEKRTQVKVGPTLVRYKEEINMPHLLERSMGSHSTIETQLNMIGNLTDRKYRWIRQGARGDQKTTYAMHPHEQEASEMPDELKALLPTLPDLEAVAFGRIEKWDSGKEPETVKVNVDGVGEDLPATPAPATETPQAKDAEAPSPVTNVAPISTEQATHPVEESKLDDAEF